MAHRTLINGTGYNVKAGRTLINGTGYAIKKGRTLINGTGFNISFEPYAITADNISQYFDVVNDSYYFAGSGAVFTSNNKNVNSSTARTALTAKFNMTVTFNYSYSSESSYDKLTITVGGNTVANGLSGVGNSSYTGSIQKGQTIIFQYTKDSSQSSNDDCCTFSNMMLSNIVTPSAGAARDLHLSTSFTAASDVLGDPKYGYSIDSTGYTLTMWLNARRSSSSNYDTNRNLYCVSIEGIQAGDTVSFLGTNSYPPPSTELGVVSQGGTVYKSWNKNGTNVSYAFTATASGTMTIVIDDGDYDSKATYLEFSMSQLTINEVVYRFDEMKGA